MGHTVLLRFPGNSIHIPPYVVTLPVSPSRTPEAVRAPTLAELVRSSRR